MKYWEAVKKIKSGWNEEERVTHMKFKKEDGTWCETKRETVERLAGSENRILCQDGRFYKVKEHCSLAFVLLFSYSRARSARAHRERRR